ncbi:Phosphoglycerate kinase (EC [uncultured Gammaproteobacteria bacterium]|nr:Phosphoglycerate kinase (EC [uncultured Gammaproteobacteria bacterium]
MIINLEELELGGKKVLIRQDLNVPIKAGVVTSDKRIKASLPTIEMAMKQGAKVMLMSHRGRPIEGEVSDEFTLQPVADRLSELLGSQCV